MVMHIFFLIIIFMISLMPPLAEGAAFYFVDKAGSDENTCAHALSQKTPKLTINGGLACMKGGDTLNIKHGTYREYITHNAIPSGSAGNYTVVTAFGDGPVTIFPDSGGAAGDAVWFYGQRYITLKGLIIDASNVPVQGIRFNNGAHHILIQDTEIKNAHWSNCIGVNEPTSHHLVFDKLKVHDCADGRIRVGHGMYLYGYDHIVKNSEIYHNNGHGIHVYAEASASNHGNILFGNKVFNNASTGVLIGSGNHNIAYNNIIWGNGAITGVIGGIRIAFRNAEDNQIYNNTVYKNAGFAITIASGTKNSVVQNNILWQNGSDVVDDNGSASSVSHNISVDPDFVDETTKNFKLNSGSPAIDAGTEVGIVSQDIEGVPRPNNDRHDVGVYEFKSSRTFDELPPTAPIGVRITN